MLKQAKYSGNGEILEKIQIILNGKGIWHRPMRSNSGVQAIETGKAVIVGNRYLCNINGDENVVSVDQRIVKYCDRERTKLVFYVLERNEFIEIDPKAILTNGWENLRGKEVYLNVNALKYGRILPDISKLEKMSESDLTD